MRLKKVAIGSLVFFLSLTILWGSLVWLEIGIRVFRPLYFEYIKKAPDEYYELPGTYDIAQHNIFSHVYRPKYRYQGEIYTQKKPEGTLRVVTLGGSTTYGHGVGTNNFSKILERMLNESGHKTQVVNSGTISYQSFHSLIDYMSNGLDLSPEFAVWYSNVNDMTADTPYVSADMSESIRVGGHWTHHMYVTTLLRRAGILDPLMELLPNFPTVTQTVKSNIVYEGLKVHPQQYEKEVANHRIMGIFRRNVENFIAVSLANQVVPVLGLVASMYGASQDEANKIGIPPSTVLNSSMIQGVKAMNDIMIDLGHKYNIPVVATNSIDGNSKYFLDQVHQSVEGHTEQAKQIYNAIYPMIANKTHAAAL